MLLFNRSYSKTEAEAEEMYVRHNLTWGTLQDLSGRWRWHVFKDSINTEQKS